MSTGRPEGSKNKTFHKWTEEEKEYLASIVKGYISFVNIAISIPSFINEINTS